MLVPKVNAHFSTKDFFLGMSALFGKTKIDNSTDLFFLNHARAGLRIALTALNLPQGSNIGISAYNCYTVMNAIKQAGHSVVFLDTTDELRLDLNDLSEKKNELDALIVTHLFGLPNDLITIKEICSTIPIIEDCAHSFLSNSNEFETGTMGDFAVFSIGLGKFPSIGDGGILKVNNHNYLKDVLTEFDALKAYSLLSELKLMVKLKLTSIIHNPFIYKWISLPKKKKQQQKKSINANYLHKESVMAKSIFCLYNNKKNLYEEYKKTQQKHSEVIWDKIQNHKEITLPNIDFLRNNCFMFPFLLADRERFAEKVSTFGVEIAPHFAKSIEWAKEFGYLEGSCKNSEKIAGQLLVIPVHYHLKERDFEKLVNGLKLNNSY